MRGPVLNPWPPLMVHHTYLATTTTCTQLIHDDDDDDEPPTRNDQLRDAGFSLLPPPHVGRTCLKGKSGKVDGAKREKVQYDR
ncbi:unnamed protein product [Linum trigynum]|uniref:Uncharacterized protein n=1 Tax=Linum trigynum TaxID=586398 RepID=A0AAV2GRF5_9ROSI